MRNKKNRVEPIFARNDIFFDFFIGKDFIEVLFSKGIIFSVTRGLDDEFSLKVESRINGLSLGYLVDG